MFQRICTLLSPLKILIVAYGIRLTICPTEKGSFEQMFQLNSMGCFGVDVDSELSAIMSTFDCVSSEPRLPDEHNICNGV